MYFKGKTRQTLWFMPMVLLLVLLTACGTNENSDEVMQSDLRYVVSLSRSRERVSKLLFYKDNGEMYKELDYRGCSINSLNYVNNKILMHSNRKNEHYSFDDSGGFEKFSLTSKKSELREGPTWVAVSDEAGLIETINLGKKKDSEYLSSVLYDYDGEKKEVLLRWEYLNNAVNAGDKIFIESYNDEIGKNGIIVIKKENEEVTKVYFEKDFTSSSSRLVLFKDKILTYGDNAGVFSEEKMSAVGTVDIDSLETREQFFENESILIAYVVEDVVKIVTDQKNVYSLNKNLEIIGKENLKNSDFIDYYTDENIVLRKILDNDNIISVLYTSKSFNKEKVGFILEYDKEDLKVIKKIDIFLKKEKNRLTDFQ